MWFINSIEGDTASFATPEVGVNNTETCEWAMQGKFIPCQNVVFSALKKQYDEGLSFSFNNFDKKFWLYWIIVLI